MASIGKLCEDGCGRLAAVSLSYEGGDDETVVCLTCSTTRERSGDVFTRRWLDDYDPNADARSIPIEPPPAVPEEQQERPSSEAG